MPIDVSNFISPEQSYAGLYRIGDQMRMDERLRSMQAFEQQKQQDLENARKNTAATYFKNYLNPKNFFTGTVDDPVIGHMVNGAMNQAMGLISQGADTASTMMAISPTIDQISQASNNLKALKALKDQHLAFLKTPAGVGVDADKYSKAFDQAAFYDNKGKLKDLSQIDPTQDIDAQVMANPDVYNNDALNKWASLVANSADTTKQKRTFVASNGRTLMTEGVEKKPFFAVPEFDGAGKFKGYVPDYENATDEGNVLYHNFKGDNGEDVKAPIRMVTQDVFDALPTAYHQKLMAEANNYIQKNPQLKLDINSLQAQNLAKTLAYNDLKPLAGLKSNYQIVTSNKQPQTGTLLRNRLLQWQTDSAGNPIDLYTPLQQDMQDRVAHPENYPNHILNPKTNKPVTGAIPFNSLNGETQQTILGMLKPSFPEIDESNIFIAPDENNQPAVFNNDTGDAIARLTKSGINIAANKPLGIKNKQAVVAEEGKNVSPVTTTKKTMQIRNYNVPDVR